MDKRPRNPGFFKFLIQKVLASSDVNVRVSNHRCSGKHITADEVKNLLEMARENGDPIPNFSGKCLHDEVLSGIINLDRVRFDYANLQGANLSRCSLKHASLREANLQDADLYSAILIDANLEKANLHNSSLAYVDLTRANLVGANIRGADLKGAIFYRTLMRLDSLGKYIRQENEQNFLDAQAIYLTLKENFQSIGSYDAASWAYVRERVSERHTFSLWRAIEYYGPKHAYHPNVTQQNKSQKHRLMVRIIQSIRRIKTMFEPIGFWIVHKYWWKWATSLAQEWMWGYGQQPARVIGICLIIVPLFAFIYLIDGGIQSPHGRPDFDELLLYSLASFTTSTMPEISPISRSAQALSSFEGILGVTTLALFTTALAQRMGGR